MLESEKEMADERILMFSHRNIADNIFARCILYEFEDMISKIDNVKVLAPKPDRFFKYKERLANRISHDLPIAINPGIPKIKIDQEYELFITICEFAKDLLNLISLKGWKERCKSSLCYIDEILLNEFMNVKCFQKLISDFDHVVVSCKQGKRIIRKAISGKCIFLPPGVDALLFCPYPYTPERCIDVLSIGRRSKVTHLKLLDMTKNNKVFYLFDSTNGSQFIDFKEHRLMLTNLLKRSKYFFVNPGKIDVPNVTGGEDLIGSRYFEGAAAGCVMIGEIPENNEFKELFCWPEPVIQLPFDSDYIDMKIDELNAQPERIAMMRKNNIIGTLKYHDWAYRWEAMLNMAGLKPLPQLLKRKEKLRNLYSLMEALNFS